MPRVPSTAAAHIGARVRAAREAKGMSHDSLGNATGIDSSNIRSYETGRALPNIYSLMRIALALETTPGDLLEGVTLDQFDGGLGARRVG